MDKFVLDENSWGRHLTRLRRGEVGLGFEQDLTKLASLEELDSLRL